MFSNSRCTNIKLIHICLKLNLWTNLYNTTTTIFLISSCGLTMLKHYDLKNRDSSSTKLLKGSKDIIWCIQYFLSLIFHVVCHTLASMFSQRVFLFGSIQNMWNYLFIYLWQSKENWIHIKTWWRTLIQNFVSCEIWGK